jgi:hypothetical protein
VRRLATADRIRRLLRELGRASREPTTLYLTGGATAVLHGWRETTIDVDIKLVPDRDEILRAIQRLKDELEVNVELASPDLFLPVTDDWEAASPWETTESHLVVRHFDLRAQALGKVERGHDRDLADVAAMLDRGLVTAGALWRYFDAIRPQLYRFPAVDERRLAEAIEAAVGPPPKPDDT